MQKRRSPNDPVPKVDLDTARRLETNREEEAEAEAAAAAAVEAEAEKWQQGQIAAQRVAAQRGTDSGNNSKFSLPILLCLAALVIIGVLSLVRGTTWEYGAVQIWDDSSRTGISVLNEKGKDGWELVVSRRFAVGGRGGAEMIFKR